MHFATAKGLLSSKNGFNVFRGCTHGCIYCDSRSRCYQINHPFEDVEVKENAPQLLEDALRAKRKPCMIGTGSMCDPYAAGVEDKLGYTRKCLEIIDKYGFGLSILTKSDLILRDMDLLRSINKKSKCVVEMTLTTFDDKLCRIIEPNVCTTGRRYDALCAFRDAGIPTVVWLCPILPFINDTEENIAGIVDLCSRAGVRGILYFGAGVTLREGDREYFYAALDRHFPGLNLKERYIKKYGFAYEAASEKSPSLNRLFYSLCKERGISADNGAIFSFLRDYPEKQLSFF